LLKIHILGLQTLLACFQTTPARILKKPQTIAGRFAFGRALRSVSQRSVKNFLRFARISQHQKTEAVKL